MAATAAAPLVASAEAKNLLRQRKPKFRLYAGSMGDSTSTRAQLLLLGRGEPEVRLHGMTRSGHQLRVALRVEGEEKEKCAAERAR